jgi:hypothetical protein
MVTTADVETIAAINAYSTPAAPLRQAIARQSILRNTIPLFLQERIATNDLRNPICAWDLSPATERSDESHLFPGGIGEIAPIGPDQFSKIAGLFGWAHTLCRGPNR